MASRYSAPASKSRARHTSPPGKRGEADLKNNLQPVAATTRTRLHLPSRKRTFRKVQNPPGQIETLDLARLLAPKSSLNQKSKKTPCFNLILLTPFTHATPGTLLLPA